MPLPSATRNQPSPPEPGAKLVLFLIWAALLGGVIVFRFVEQRPESEEAPAMADNAALMTVMLLGPTLVSLAIRLLWVPRATDRGKQLAACIAGMAVAEGLTIFGLFLFPARLDVFFGTSVVLILVYCPLFLAAKPAATR